MRWIPNIVTPTAEAAPLFYYGFIFSKSETAFTDNINALDNPNAMHEITNIKRSKWWVGGGEGDSLSGKAHLRGPSLTCSVRKDLGFRSRDHLVPTGLVPTSAYDGLFYPVMFPQRTGTDLGTQYFEIMIEYITMFTDPVPMHAS